MRPTTFLLLLVAMLAIMSLSAASAQAQALPLIFFDENGNNGTNFTGGAPLPSGFGPDPLSTGPPASTLFYVVPFPITTGDVQLTEPPTGISDLVRFENTGGGGMIFFYSDTGTTSDPGEDLADVGLPTLLGPPTVIAETGPDNNNSAVYIPTPGMPGFPLAGPPAIQYNIISDVPEPTSILLAALGGASLLLALRRRTS
jgi:hypothetical protein